MLKKYDSYDIETLLINFEKPADLLVLLDDELQDVNSCLMEVYKAKTPQQAADAKAILVANLMERYKYIDSLLSTVMDQVKEHSKALDKISKAELAEQTKNKRASEK